MYHSIGIVLACLCIAAFYMYKIRQLDRYEVEPLWAMLLACILGGTLSVSITYLTYDLFDLKVLSATMSATERHFFIVAPVEESAKLLALFLIYPFIRKQMNEPTDGLVYIMMVALGFAVIENFVYAQHYTVQVLYIRSVYSTLGHMANSAMIGLPFYIHMKMKRNFWGLYSGWFYAVLLHGSYNSILSSNYAYLFHFVYAYGLIMMFTLLRVTLSYSVFRKNLKQVVFRKQKQRTYQQCAACLNEGDFESSKFRRIEAQRCSHCGAMIFDYKSSRHLLRHFVPSLRAKQFLRSLDRVPSRKISPKFDVYYHASSRILSGDRHQISQYLEQLHSRERNKLLQGFTILSFLKDLGFKPLFMVKH